MKNKRIFGLAVVLLLSMVVTGGLWAQMTFGGLVSSGLGLLGNTYGDNRTVIKPYTVTDNAQGILMRLNGGYTNQDKTAGVEVRLQMNSTLQYGYLSIPHAYGWANFLSNNIQLKGGLIAADGDYNMGDFWCGAPQNMSLGLGGFFKATPTAIPGLSLGFGVFTLTQQGGANNSILAVGGPPDGTTGRLANFAQNNLDWRDIKYTYHFMYNVPNAFRTTGNFRWKNKAGMLNTVAQLNAFPPINYDVLGFYTGMQENSEFNGDLRLLAVPGLEAVVAYRFINVHEFDINGDVIVSETLSYKFGDLKLGLNMVQFLYFRKAGNGLGGGRGVTQGQIDALVPGWPHGYTQPSELDEKVSMSPSFFFNLYGELAIDKLLPRLDVNFFANGASNIGNLTRIGNTNRNDFWNSAACNRTGFVNISIPKDADISYAVFSVRPSLKINLDARTSIEIGDIINYDFSNAEGAYMDSNDASKTSQITNAFYIDFKWTF